MPRAWLPTVKVIGRKDPVIQITRDSNKEIVYTLRIKGDTFMPPVFEPGKKD